MAEKHPDLLDYLYEELPAQEMEEARKHIADCPICLEELKNLREPVKQYRDLVRPTLPQGLAERTRTKALGTVLPAPATSQKRENAESVRREIEELKAKRSWFFNPAWTVAASVFFIFAILIHFSPRGSGWHSREEAEQSTAIAAHTEERTESAAPPTIVMDAEPLPALPHQQESMAEPAEPPKPASLSIAETLVREDPVTVPDKLPSMNKSAVAAPRMAVEPAASTPPPPPAPTESIVMQYSAPVAAPAIIGSADDVQVEMPVPAAAAPAARAAPEVGTSEEEFTQELADHSAPVQEVAVPDEPKDILSLDPEELEKLLQRHGDQDDGAGSVGIVDLTGLGQPPQLIERPEAVDKNEIGRNLIFLIGVHLGEKEFDEARQGIDLLRRYEPEQANRFAAMLLELEAAQQEQPAEPVLAEPSLPEAETKTLGELIRDISDPELPEKQEELVEPPQDQPTVMQLPEGWREANAEPVVEEPAILEPQPEAATAVEQPLVEPIFESEPTIEDVPLIIGPTPDSQPPTLMESGPFGNQRFSRSQHAPSYTRPYGNRQPPATRPFTTDPYYRGD